MVRAYAPLLAFGAAPALFAYFQYFAADSDV